MTSKLSASRYDESFGKFDTVSFLTVMQWIPLMISIPGYSNSFG